MDPNPQVVGGQLFIDGYVYYKVNIVKGRWYWKCAKVGECKARAITYPEGDQVVVLKGPEKSPHDHPPNREAAEAKIVKYNLKRKAEEPDARPAQILRTELVGLSQGVLSQLPERENLKQSMRRARRKDLPPNPRTLDDFIDLPNRYQVTQSGDRFLLADSRDGGVDEGRVIVFGTRRNLEILAASEVWFLDGTFKVSPSIFTQLFTVLGTVRRGGQLPGDEIQVIAVPCIFALLSSKCTDQYKYVLETITNSAHDWGIRHCRPQRIMTDFEVAILNACNLTFNGAPLTACFFHLGQSLYRHVQSEGLQALYNDPQNRGIKLGAHMILALAFVPPDDVREAFELVRDEVDEALLPLIDYFEKNYVVGIPARGRRRAVSPRYPISLWNQYNSTVSGSQRTNNCSEGWHNRFNLAVGKNHPDVYTFLNELKKEQADYETIITELALGRKVKAGQKKVENCECEDIVHCFGI